MSTGYKTTEQDRPYYLTFQVVEWVNVFTRKELRDIIIENLKYCQENKHLELFAYVIMSNHIHLIVRSDDDNITGFIRDCKTFSSKSIINAIKTINESRKEWMMNIFENYAKNHSPKQKYQLWTHENHAEVIYSNKFVNQKINYLHNNPVRAGFVARPEHYIYSSAGNYADMDGLLKVILVKRNVKTY